MMEGDARRVKLEPLFNGFNLEGPVDTAEFDPEVLRVDAKSPANILLNIFNNLAKMMTKTDLHNAREVSRVWRFLVTQHPRYKGQANGTIHTNWYRHVKEIEAVEGAAEAGLPDWTMVPHWESMKLEHFKFYRNSGPIKTFWVETASNLTTLKVEKSTLECDAFRFLLDYSPCLKTLEMRDVNLRDYADLHRDSAEPRRLLPDTPIPPVRNQLTHITFERVNSAEGCFMDYLCKRTGFLETLSIVECFQEDPARHFRNNSPGMPTWLEVQEMFLEDVSDLVATNFQTLTSLDIFSEVSQNGAWGKLSEVGYVPEHLGITMHASTLMQMKDSIRILLGNANLKSLQLDIGQEVKFNDINEVLCMVNPALEKLKISINGKGSFEGAQGLVSLNISPALQHLRNLDRLWIQDRKILTKIEKRIISRRMKLFPYRIHRGLGIDAGRLVYTLNETNSHIDILSLKDIPATITDLRLDGVINYQDVFTDNALLPQLSDSLVNLTRLEIRGPWLTPLGGILKNLYQKSPKLRALILPACAVTDEDITGLCMEAVNGIRKGLGYAFDLYTPNDFNHRGNFAELVEKASVEWNEKRNMRREANPVPGRPTLGDLKDLVYLDLSYNPRVSDVGIYSALKLPQLQVLGLHSCHRVTDSGLALLAMNCPRLEELNVKNVRKVSAVGMSELIRHCRHLRRIYTTRVIRGRSFDGFFEVQLNPNFQDIVKVSIMTQMEDVLGKLDGIGELEDDDSSDDDDERGGGDARVAAAAADQNNEDDEDSEGDEDEEDHQNDVENDIDEGHAQEEVIEEQEEEQEDESEVESEESDEDESESDEDESESDEDESESSESEDSSSSSSDNATDEEEEEELDQELQIASDEEDEIMPNDGQLPNNDN